MQKYCPSCAVSKPASEFGSDRTSPTGLADYCKQCKREKSRAAYYASREKNLERFRKSRIGRVRYKDPHHKSNARLRVKRAIERGLLTRPDVCSVCAVPCKPDAHHTDYAQPLNVQWLCKLCHGKAHRLQEVSA